MNTQPQDQTAKATGSVEPLHFRETLGHYPTGVVIVTGVDAGGEPVGMVVGSFTSVSLHPPLVAFLPQRDSGTFARLRDASSFCVNVLAADQEDLCRRFAQRRDDKFDGVDWHPAPGGAPILDGAVAWIECDYQSVVEAGDHFVVIGHVTGMDVLRPTLPLLFFQGGYGRFTLPSLLAQVEPDLIQGIRLAEVARDQIEMVAGELEAECSVTACVGEDAVFVALASGSARPSRISLGFRVPLVPPLGAVYISHSGSVAVNEWLHRLPETDEATREAYVGQLERVRERGYSLSLRGTHNDREMFEAIRDYSSVDRLPEHERRFKAIIQETAALYEPDIEPGGSYDLHSIVVPVEGPMQQVQIALRLSNMARGIDGREVERWVERLKQAAAVVSARLIELDGQPAEGTDGLFHSVARDIGRGVADAEW
ncbi:flavin reductase [Nocardioides sp. cx-169]|uniref:flavin reductase n=1 Tax=Nocardioides sp. cx-169 TaxID=2899080 RepID=UPI001E621BD7|nr:flavin reductase [Nocardioides sp. cx-169]MCD4534325.1 flavin reductase [Nocardioides sp. cx-169]